MKISNITSSPIALTTHYLKESSWKGRTVQILLAASFLSLIIFAASRLIQPSPAKPADGKLIPVSYRDKDFVQNLLNRIDSSALGVEIVKSVSDWKEGDQPFVWKRRVDLVIVKWLSDNQPSFENAAQDPRLPAEIFSTWKKIQEEFREFVDPQKKTDEKEIGLKFKHWIVELQRFAQKKNEALKTSLSKELEKIQERQFENLAQYLQYLFPGPRSKALGIERGDIWTLGLATMDDMDVLHLRDFDQRILTLRQFCCCLNFELQGGKVSPELQESFLAKIREFRAEMAKVRAPDLKLGLKTLLDTVDAVLAKYASASLTSELVATLPQKIEELEHWDKVRQMIFLRKYIQQNHHAEVWTVLRGQNIDTLSQYCGTYEVLDNPNALYQLATSLHL